MIIIETDRLLVRNFRAEDWKDLQEYLSREEVMRFESAWDTSDEGMRKAAVELSRGNSFWACELMNTGKMIGHVYLGKEQPEAFNTWMLGYIFNNDHYGNGYATEACKAVLEYAFRVMGVYRVIAKCSPENEASWKLLERLGMSREGRSLRCASIKKTPTGEPIWWDELLYAMLSVEWPGYEVNSIRETV
jgi:RimJ/RimL family protein N-acetyltransferase